MRDPQQQLPWQLLQRLRIFRDQAAMDSKMDQLQGGSCPEGDSGSFWKVLSSGVRRLCRRRDAIAAARRRLRGFKIRGELYSIAQDGKGEWKLLPACCRAWIIAAIRKFPPSFFWGWYRVRAFARFHRCARDSVCFQQFPEFVPPSRLRISACPIPIGRRLLREMFLVNAGFEQRRICQMLVRRKVRGRLAQA